MPSELFEHLWGSIDGGLWSSGSALVWRYFDLGASFIWAITGALLAAQRGYDVTGIYAIALVSATGGGLLRDGLFLQQGPPAILMTPLYILLVGVAATLVWALGKKMLAWGSLTRFSRIVDAFGLGGFAVVGMQLAMNLHLSLPAVVLVGVINAVGGGVLRSLLLRETPEIFKPGTLIALAAMLGCLLHLALTRGAGVDPRIAAAATIAFVALVRAGSVRYGFRTRAARGFEEPPPGL